MRPAFPIPNLSLKGASYYGPAAKSRRRRSRRSDALQAFDAIMGQRGLIHIQAQARILRNDALAIGELEGLLAMEQRQEGLAIIFRQPRRTEHRDFLIDRAHRRRQLQ